jgi:hypothetical protein
MARRRKRITKRPKNMKAPKSSRVKNKKLERDIGGFVTKEDDNDYILKKPGEVRTVRKKPAVPILPTAHADPVRTMPTAVYAEPSQEEPQYRTAFYKHQIANDAAQRKVYRSRLVGQYDTNANSSQFRARDKWHPLDDEPGLMW